MKCSMKFGIARFEEASFEKKKYSATKLGQKWQLCQPEQSANQTTSSCTSSWECPRRSRRTRRTCGRCSSPAWRRAWCAVPGTAGGGACPAPASTPR